MTTEQAIIPIGDVQKRKTDKLREQVQRLLERHGLSQADLADNVGISRSVISSWLGDKYPHDGDVVPAIESWVVRVQGGEEELQFIELKNSKKVFNACQLAVAKRKIAIVLGPPGLGKTFALQEWFRRAYREKQEVVFYHVSPYIRKGSLARMLARRLQISESRTAHDVVEEVIARLRRRPATLLFDEANHLDVPCLEAIRYIHDSVRAPVVLCGSRKLYKTLIEPTERFFELEQLQSRIAINVELAPLEVGEVREYLRHHLAEIPAEVVSECHKLSHGIVRNLANGADNMKRLMKLNKLTVPTVELARKAFEQQVG